MQGKTVKIKELAFKQIIGDAAKRISIHSPIILFYNYFHIITSKNSNYNSSVTLHHKPS